MGGLFGSLNSSLQALRAFETALNVSQNNVSNSSTPGYARQTIQLEAQPFDANGGLAGGVKAGQVQSTDNPYADQAVRNQLSQLRGGRRARPVHDQQPAPGTGAGGGRRGGDSRRAGRPAACMHCAVDPHPDASPLTGRGSLTRPSGAGEPAA